MRSILCSILVFLMVGTVQAKNLLGLPDELTQGGLYTGRVAPGSMLWLGDQRLKLSPEGYFVFGLNWQQGSMVKFRLVDPPMDSVLGLGQGASHLQRFAVGKQEYDVQYIDGLPPKMVTPPTETLVRIKADSARVKKARATDSNLQDFRAKFIWPVRGRISGKFGNHRVLNGIPKSPHTGMDIAAPKGTLIVAPLGGIVTLISDLYYTGNTLIIDHGFGVSTVFAHMDTVTVRMGQVIKQGDQIGTVGATGRATGPHLHWGLNWYKERLNPALVLGD